MKEYITIELNKLISHNNNCLKFNYSYNIKTLRSGFPAGFLDFYLFFKLPSKLHVYHLKTTPPPGGDDTLLH